MLKKVFLFYLKNRVSELLLIFVGTISWSVTMVKSGWLYPYGMGFWGANGHDGIWHIALAESLSKENLQMPVFAGAKIQNYHLGFDFLLAFLHKTTRIPISNLYFQVIPPILALLIGFLTYKFVFEWTKSKISSFWATFFVYFGGSFGWVIGKGESAFWSQQAVSSLINPPFAMSLTILLIGMILLLKLKDKFKILNFIFIIFCFGTLIEIKIYAGLLVLGGLLTTGLYSLIFDHKSTIIKIFAGTLVVSLLLYLPFNKISNGLIIWQPFWFLETMIAASDKIFIPKLAEAMMSYKNQNVISKFLVAYGLTFVIFIVGNFGTRIFFLFRKIKQITDIDVFIYSITIAGILLPTFFIQRGTTWNTIQFFYYSLFFAGILSGIVISGLFNNLNSKIFAKYLTEFTLVLLTIPTTFFSLRDIYIPSRPPAMLTPDEIIALNFLKGQKDGVVLTYPYDQKISDLWTTPPKPLYLYVSTAYVSAFSGHITFLEDEMNLDITGFPWLNRKKEIISWYKETDVITAKKFLKNNQIKYIYLLNGQKTTLGNKQLGLKKIFENLSVIIYQVED